MGAARFIPPLWCNRQSRGQGSGDARRDVHSKSLTGSVEKYFPAAWRAMGNGSLPAVFKGSE
jgi:hypothetical protein